MLPISYWSRHLEFRMASDVELEEIIVAVRSLNETLDSLVKYGRDAVRRMSQCFIDFYPLSTILCFNPFPKKPWFLRVCSTSLLKTLWDKEKLLITSNFSFSHRVFYPSEEVSLIFIKLLIFVCKLFQFGQV